MSIYFGPYLKITISNKLKPHKITTCDNPTCQNFGKFSSYNYCYECGSKIETKETTIQDEFFAETLYNTITDNPFTFKETMDNDIHYLFPRNEVQHDKDLDVVEMPLDPFYMEDPDYEISVFKMKYAKEIEMLENGFGKENVNTGYGILCYYV